VKNSLLYSLYNHPHERGAEVMPIMLRLLGKFGIDLIFLLIREDPSIKYDLEWKKYIADALVHFHKEYGDYIKTKARAAFPSLSLDDIEKYRFIQHLK
jgi:hypothetical protein